MTARTAAGVLTAAFALVGAGCGDGDGDDASSGTPSVAASTAPAPGAPASGTSSPAAVATGPTGSPVPIGPGGPRPVAPAQAARSLRGAERRCQAVRGPRRTKDARRAAARALVVGPKRLAILDGVRATPEGGPAALSFIESYRRLLDLYSQVATAAPGAPSATARQTRQLLASAEQSTQAAAVAAGLGACGPLA